MAPQPAVKLKKTEGGLNMSYFEGSWKKLPDFSSLKPLKKGISRQVGLQDVEHRNNEFAVVLEGSVDITRSGVQTFFINSDDGSRLYINDQLVIDHDGDHSAIKKTGQLILAPGKHKLRIEYFEASGSQFLQAGMMDEKRCPLHSRPFICLINTDFLMSWH